MADETNSRHLGLFAQCGVCAEAISRHERVMALIGNHDSTSYHSHTRPFPFPQLGPTITRVQGSLLCRYPGCRRCTASPECQPIHHDCYEMVRASCPVEEPELLARLWASAAWRRPWRGAQPVYLSRRGLDMGMLATAVSLGGLPLLCKLPGELLEIIRGFSRTSSFWRYISALRLATVLSQDPEPPVTLPLSHILSWEHDGRLQSVSSPSPPPIIRFTISSQGICKVESLSHTPQYAGECHDDYAFIISHRRSVSGVRAHLKNGILRLQLPPEIPSLPIWNTPAPPELSSCRACPDRLSPWQRFRAVELDETTGITFFFSTGRLVGIHIHHRLEESDASRTYERFSNRFRRSIVWIHLPVPKGERLLALGVRDESGKRHNILARTRKTGDIILGQYIKDGFKDWCLGRSAPMTLVHGEPTGEQPVPFFGVHCPVSSDRSLPKPFPLLKPGPNPLEDGAYFSWAPLDRVLSTTTFNDETTGFCRGIRFQYENGGSRTVGQCRLGADPPESVVRPLTLCFRAEACPSRWNRLHHRVEVKFKHCPPQEQLDQGWNRHALQGFVKFWFTSKSSFLIVEN